MEELVAFSNIADFHGLEAICAQIYGETLYNFGTNRLQPNSIANGWQLSIDTYLFSL